MCVTGDGERGKVLKTGLKLTCAGNTLLSPWEKYGAFHFSIAQVPSSETFSRLRGAWVGSERKGTKKKLFIISS